MKNNTDTFEQSMAELEEILEKLSASDVALDESLTLYAQAAGLIEQCYEKLNAAKLKIEEIDLKIENVKEQFA